MRPIQPLHDELDEGERALLTLLAPTGLDWLTTREQFAERHGTERYCDTWDTTALLPTTALCEMPLVFRMHRRPGTLDLPPDHLFASYLGGDDARENHALIEAQIVERLGAPEHRDTVNCLARVWRFGLLCVKLHTFPPELQNPPLRNVLHDYDSRLRVASSISIGSDHAWIHADAGLLPLVELLDTDQVVSLPDGVRLPWQRYGGCPRRATRRHPRALVRALRGRRALAWHDEVSVAVCSPERSVVADRKGSTLVLQRVTAARGPAGSELLVRERPDDGRREVGILFGDRIDTLDGLASTLATAWGMRLVKRSRAND